MNQYHYYVMNFIMFRQTRFDVERKNDFLSLYFEHFTAYCRLYIKVFNVDIFRKIFCVESRSENRIKYYLDKICNIMILYFKMMSARQIFNEKLVLAFLIYIKLQTHEKYEIKII